MPKSSAEFIARSRRAVEDIVLGRDDRLLTVVGPCSIHDPAAALEYARLLKAMKEETQMWAKVVRERGI